MEDTPDKVQKFCLSYSFNSIASFKKKPRRIIMQRKTARICFIWLWVYWLAEHSQKSAKYQFIKFGPLKDLKQETLETLRKEQ